MEGGYIWTVVCESEQERERGGFNKVGRVITGDPKQREMGWNSRYWILFSFFFSPLAVC